MNERQKARKLMWNVLLWICGKFCCG